MIYLNGVKVVPTIFPDKTSQVWKLSKDFIYSATTAVVRWEFESEAEFMHVAQLKKLLDQYDIVSELSLPYLPYARQDKKITNETTFALRVFASLLNLISFSTVRLLDPHSDLALKLINNSILLTPFEYISKAWNETGADIFCYPDSGAAERYTKCLGVRGIYGVKERDQLTGDITSYTIRGEVKDKSILIVDDICDGGATFVLLAQQLLFDGAKEVNLYVTHGIFSKGTKRLFEAGIKRIFTHKGEVNEEVIS